MSRARTGFTLIEILVVISIIAILAALLMPALTMLRNQQKQVATSKLLQQISLTLDQYLIDHAVFGSMTGGTTTLSSGAVVSRDAFERPLVFLVRDAEHPLELKLAQMGRGTPTGPVARPDEAEVLLDAWHQPISVFARNLRSGDTGPWYTQQLQLVSRGAGDRIGDDVVQAMQLPEARWQREPIIEYDVSDYRQ